MKNKNKPNIIEMLAYRRPARSNTEAEFIARYIDSIPGVYADAYGNRILRNPESRVIISTHTDTVHRIAGKQNVRRKGNIVRLAKSSVLSNCLGADDTAGVYAALRMIDAGVPVTYIFHRDEEIGGKGSYWLADHYPDWFKQHDICLALDRRGTGDIITSQCWNGTCASAAFAESLSNALGMGHTPAAGVFTDSANYTHLIPECSNLSIGYQHEHTPNETLDLDYLEAITARLIEVPWNQLTVARDPNEADEPFDWWKDYQQPTATEKKNVKHDFYGECELCFAQDEELFLFEDLLCCIDCYHHWRVNSSSA